MISPKIASNFKIETAFETELYWSYIFFWNFEWWLSLRMPSSKKSFTTYGFSFWRIDVNIRVFNSIRLKKINQLIFIQFRNISFPLKQGLHLYNCIVNVIVIYFIAITIKTVRNVNKRTSRYNINSKSLFFCFYCSSLSGSLF